MKVGTIILIIGRQGSGKTPTAKELMNKSTLKNKIVYDYRREYDKEKNVSLFFNYEIFKNNINNFRNSFIIIEEATAFISAFKDMELTNFLIGIEHNQNVCCLLFHSIQDIPLFIYRYARFTILLETNDDVNLIKRSRPKMYNYLIQKNKPIYIDNHSL